MLTIKQLPEFSLWLRALKDSIVRGAVVARIKRLASGNMGDVTPVGSGVNELRIHMGAGWRVYFVKRGESIVVLLCAGSKKTQDADIKRALRLSADLE